MADLTLLPRTDGSTPPTLRDVRSLTVVGANGAGKTRFMKEMIRSLEGRSYSLSALQASFPERKPSTLEGSIDRMYEEAVRTKPYMRRDAVSELDKLGYMLLSDEFDALLRAKTRAVIDDKPIAVVPTRLDKLMRIWGQIFPGHRILREGGELSFETESGDEPATTMALSHGEKAVFYYIAAALYARPNSVIFIDDPTIFLHPAIYNTLWNAIEELRPDCTFVYSTVDPDFVNARTGNVCIWIRGYDIGLHAWDYQVLAAADITDDIFIDIIGSRKPVLFIEGDGVHSIDNKLYSLVFSDYTVRPLGSCNKVIETTRSFNDLQRMHHLDSHGIVDRDRRTDAEVEYLRRKHIFVPNVAEVENIFLLEDVIRIMARHRGLDGDSIFRKVRGHVIGIFMEHYKAQALQHVRHRMKRDVECKIDARFTCITALETHLAHLGDKLQPRMHYDRLVADFEAMIERGDYSAIIRIFNHKPLLSDCMVAPLLGFDNKDEYIFGVLEVLKGLGQDAADMREAVKRCFGLSEEAPADATESAGDTLGETVSGFPYADPDANPYASRRKKRKKARAKKNTVKRRHI